MSQVEFKYLAISKDHEFTKPVRQVVTVNFDLGVNTIIKAEELDLEFIVTDNWFNQLMRSLRLKHSIFFRRMVQVQYMIRHRLAPQYRWDGKDWTDSDRFVRYNHLTAANDDLKKIKDGSIDYLMIK